MFIDDLLDRLYEDVEYTREGDQDFLKSEISGEENNFPMICFEYTDDSDIEVSIDESKFLNDSSHNGMWIAGYNSDDTLVFLLCLKDFNKQLEIDTFEVNKNFRSDGLGRDIITDIEKSAKLYYENIVISPFDTNAMNFWNHMGYNENNDGKWVKMLKRKW